VLIAMTFADQLREHQARCQPHLVNLRMLARGDSGAAVARPVTAEVRQETNAIIAEAESAVRAARACGRKPEAETFLLVRLTRLAAAASGGDGPRLSRHLRRFDALTSAIWTVQHAVYSHAAAHPAANRPVSFQRAAALPGGRLVKSSSRTDRGACPCDLSRFWFDGRPSRGRGVTRPLLLRRAKLTSAGNAKGKLIL
jgi:hypothetical protein